MRRLWLLMVVATVLPVAWLAAAGIRSLPVPVSAWIAVPMVFTVSKLAGDLLLFLVCMRPEVFYFEDFLWELAVFVGLGLVGAVAIVGVERFFGIFLGPALPAAAAYGAFLLAGRDPVRWR